MKGAGATRPLGSEILYSTCWEDLAVARAALRVPVGGRVLAIAAAGDNALGLLLDDPAHILAVDINPAQTALAELKLSAIRALGERIAGFVGAAQSDVRRTDYRRLRSLLSPSAALFWDARQTTIERGVIHAGRFERHVAAFRRWLQPVAPGRAAVRAMLGARDVDEQRLIYRRDWDSRRWRLLFRLAFNRRALAALGRHPAFFTHAPRLDVARHFLARVEFGLTATPIGDNPYVTFALTGGYRLPGATPDYLLAANAAVLAARAERLEVHTVSLFEALRSLPDQSIDAFYLSDVFELADPAGFEATLAQVARVGRPGARVCYWNNLVERSRPDTLAGRLEPEAALAEQLSAQDRAFLYSRLVIEHVDDGGAAGLGRVA